MGIAWIKVQTPRQSKGRCYNVEIRKAQGKKPWSNWCNKQESQKLKELNLFVFSCCSMFLKEWFCFNITDFISTKCLIDDLNSINIMYLCVQLLSESHLLSIFLIGFIRQLLKEVKNHRFQEPRTIYELISLWKLELDGFYSCTHCPHKRNLFNICS